jgi:archaellum component FlaC
MEDKMFELMSKIYGELTEFRTETNKRLDSLENDIVRLENKLDTNSKTLFDGYKQTYEKVMDVENAVKDLSTKVEKQEVEIKVIKGGKS